MNGTPNKFRSGLDTKTDTLAKEMAGYGMSQKMAMQVAFKFPELSKYDLNFFLGSVQTVMAWEESGAENNDHALSAILTAYDGWKEGGGQNWRGDPTIHGFLSLNISLDSVGERLLQCENATALQTFTQHVSDNIEKIKQSGKKSKSMI